MVGSNLYTVAADGSRVQRLLHGQANTLVVYRPTWSPRATGTIATYGESAEDGETGIVLFRDGRERAVRVLAQAPDRGSEVEWSPDGSKLAFVSRSVRSDSFLASVVTVVEAATSDEHRLVQTRSRDIAWSPDGTRIAFARCPSVEFTSSCQLRSVDINTNRTRAIRPIYPAGWDWR